MIYTGKIEKFDWSRKRQAKIASKKEEIQGTILRGKQKVQTPIWKVFEESYKSDLEVGTTCIY